MNAGGEFDNDLDCLRNELQGEGFLGGEVGDLSYNNLSVNSHLLHQQVGKDIDYGLYSESISDKSSPSTNGSHIMTGVPVTFPADNNKSYENWNTTFNTTKQDGGQPKKTKKQILDEQDAILIAKDDSELSEAELNMKRKAQNRAAQRAFRERKETKLKELETQLTKSEEEKQRLIEELEAVRNVNLKMVNRGDFPKTEQQFVDGILYGTNHMYHQDYKNKTYESPEGSKILLLGATWDYLLFKAEYEDLNIDIVEVMNHLRGNEKCHGFGPGYPVDVIDRAIEECKH